MRIFGGVALLEIMDEMNLDVMPITGMSETTWNSRASWNVAPRAP